MHWQDISSPLANRIIRCRDQFQNWEQFCELLKTKELTYTRISRALLHVCLEIPDPDKSVPPLYARILGFQKSAFCELLKTKELTYTRISRALLHVCLEIPDPDKSVPPLYARILGFQKSATPLFSLLKKESRIPLITKLASAALTSKAAEDMIQEDVHSANLYESVVTDKFQRPFHNEYRQSIIRL